MPAPVDCGIFLVDINTQYGLGGGFGLQGVTVSRDGTIWFVADTGFINYHLFSVPISNLAAITDWGAYTGFGPPVATSTQLAWIDGSNTDGTIAIVKAPFSNPIAGASAAFTDASGDLHIRNLAVADDGAHVIALVEHGFSGSATDTSKIWRVDLDAGTKTELYSHGSPFGSETDDDLAIVGVNKGLDVGSDGWIWCGTYSGRKFFVLAPDGSSHIVFGGDGFNDVRVFGALCDGRVVVNDPMFLVIIGGVPRAQYVDALIDQTETVRDCEPFDQNAKTVTPSGLSMGRQPDWKRWVWAELNQSTSHTELWIAHCLSAPFEFPFRWVQFYKAFLHGKIPTPKPSAPAAPPVVTAITTSSPRQVVALLTDRDRALEDHLGDFSYSTRWATAYDSLLSGDPQREQKASDLLDQRDRELEQHLGFDYTIRWGEVQPALLSDRPEEIRKAVALLETRDRELEDHLRS